MKHLVSSVVREAPPLAWLLALANLLFFISFVVLLTLAAGQARAEDVAKPIVCAGKDLLVDLAKTDPAAIAKIDADARATPNGYGLLWKIEKAGNEPSYLFGTMHMTDPRVLTLPPAAQSAFDSAGTTVIETTEVLDQAEMLKNLMSKPELTMFTDATTLDSLLTPEQREIVHAGLEARGIPPGTVSKMKPWMLSTMLALPACELARKQGGAPVLDVELAQKAKAAGKSVEGLETVADQLEAMASLPMEFHVQGLVDTIRLGDRMEDVIETMIVLYTQQETGKFWPLFRAVMPDEGNDASGYAAFEQTMVVARNHTMLEHATPIVDEGTAFIAVGALHLPGPDGLVELFRKAGYTVTPVL